MSIELYDRVTVVMEPQSEMLLAIEPGDPLPTFILPMQAVKPEFKNLLAAAHLLYRVNRETRLGLELLIEVLEQHGGDALVGSIQAFASNLQTAERCAVEGLHIIAQSQK
jgi:hypothetical protein